MNRNRNDRIDEEEDSFADDFGNDTDEIESGIRGQRNRNEERKGDRGNMRIQ
jgi:hypothetical protein